MGVDICKKKSFLLNCKAAEPMDTMEPHEVLGLNC